MPATLADLMNTLPQAGQVEWLGIRPARGAPMEAMDAVNIVTNGLETDRRVLAGSRPGKRSVTIIQHEHLAVIASLLGEKTISPHLLRRNIVVRGINLLALKKRAFSIGGAVLRGTDVCAPCSKMETILGDGGYNAMRGHGGICAEVLRPGKVTIGDAVVALSAD